ncbi:class Ib ribonucleoside-diphosphate reductase assembly flavoprotein NrdI [Kocuria sp. JC486]|uniref:class Ib ribonucleoside-diphosphate reductase assembly flavoprotein NrdI n=1 Tax=Kocuria sp. JC486 TaxID=1970736 RepID=UPI00141ECB75|nr:class Ib ribonucleoside-diphosphate reductase assembly flavoprotein NrdI [Kocuria sp. JC486]NHU84174.1 class Ib ribonucleoside-diphosphate reductase assembly flavoprotein NrdI [Kocuria sp. JC486]
MSALAALVEAARQREAHQDDARGAPGQRPDGADDPVVVYFSSVSGNTRRFVEKLWARKVALPLHTAEDVPVMEEPYVLVVPTYGRPEGAGAVPPQVVKFLNVEANRKLLRGVLGAGNTNFGEKFCIAAEKISAKCGVPVLYKFELMGTEEDVNKVNEGLMNLWQ